MTVGGTLKAQYARRRRGPGEEDQLSILEKEEKPGEEEEEEEEEGQTRGAPAGGGPPRPEPGGAPGGSSKGVHFAILPEKYEPLGGGEEAPARGRERKGQRRRRKLKKYGKNVGKALQKGCRYLVLGLQGLANAYSSPLGVAVSIATALR